MTRAEAGIECFHSQNRRQDATVKAVPIIIAAALAAPSLDARAASEDRNTAPHFDLGGAVRFNYGWLDYGPTSRLQLELLRADIDAGSGPFSFSAQYRCSPTPRS
ncbi:hypothetical protein G6F22_019397 [Rhizopus arrhizus]|nr:hypothetical protein G6F22_019397 [Rhizopus arrhizus]